MQAAAVLELASRRHCLFVQGMSELPLWVVKGHVACAGVLKGHVACAGVFQSLRLTCLLLLCAHLTACTEFAGG